MSAVRNSNLRTTNQKVPEWEAILSLYAPFVVFYIGLWSGNLTTVISMGYIQVAAIFLVAIIVLNIVFRAVKFEHGLLLLVYVPIMRLGNMCSVMLFLAVLTDYLAINPVHSISIFVFMFLLLAYNMAIIKMSSSQSIVEFGIDFLKMVFAISIVICLTDEQGTWLIKQIEMLLSFVFPIVASIYLGLLSVVLYFIACGLLVWGIHILFSKIASLVRLMFKWQRSALALRTAVGCAQIIFAVLVLYI